MSDSPAEDVKRLASKLSPASVHLRPPRAPAVLCGLGVKSVRHTRRLALATCAACLEALRVAVDEAEKRRMEAELRRLHQLGQLPAEWTLPPVSIAEPAEDAQPPFEDR